MKKVVLTDPGTMEEAALCDEFRRLAGLPKVYLTTVNSPGSRAPEHFITTSKDIHLTLGRMTESAKWTLAVMVHDELRDQPAESLVIVQDEEVKVGWLATILDDLEQGSNCIHLSKTE